MVRYLILFCFACIMVKGLQAQELSSALVFEERVFNFGTIQEKDGKVSHTFYFRNAGKAPVTIGEVNTGCGCIANVLRKGPVKPGEKAALTITFDPSYKAGFFSKEIFVFSEGGKQYSHVWIEGTIVPAAKPVQADLPYDFGSGLYLRYKVLALGYVRPGATKQIELPLANAGKNAINVHFVPRKYQDGLSFTNPGTVAPATKATVTFNYKMPFITQDEVLIELDVFVNGKKQQEPLVIRVLKDNKL